LKLGNDRTRVSDVAVTIGHGDIWRITITHQEDPDAVDGQRNVDSEAGMIRFFARSGGHLQGCGVIQGLTEMGVGFTVKDYIEVCQLDPKWRETFFREGGAGSKGIIGDQVVGKTLAFDDDLLTLIFVEATDAHEHDDSE